MQSSQKVAFNTFVMYAKVLITVGVTLYSTRLVLNELGAEDFGIFNLVAGIVGMLAFLNTSVSVAAQRYLAYTLGENNKEHYEEVYVAAKKIALYLAILLFVVIEIFGLFFLEKLNYPLERSESVQVIFQCMAFSTFFSIWAIPYEAAIVANEDIYVISLIYIVESILKLFIAIYLIYTPYDKLMVYGALLVSVYILMNIYKNLYCRKYGASVCTKSSETGVIKGMIKFSGWTALDPLTTLFSVQGIAVLLNLFGGAVVNAAYGIANQVSGQLNYFSVSLLGAFYPQIMKSEGKNDRARTARLSVFACKLSFFLLIFFSVPLLVEMPFVLKIWLDTVPENTVLFCRLVLMSIIVLQLSAGLQGGIVAIGEIKYYQLTIGFVKIMALLIAFLLLMAGLPVFVAVMSFVGLEMVNFVVRVAFAKRIMSLNIKDILWVTVRLLMTFVIVVSALCWVKGFFYGGFHRLVIVILLSCVLNTLMLRYVILTKTEFLKVKSTLKGLFFLKFRK